MCGDRFVGAAHYPLSPVEPVCGESPNVVDYPESPDELITKRKLSVAERLPVEVSIHFHHVEFLHLLENFFWLLVFLVLKHLYTNSCSSQFFLILIRHQPI
jgi:membrane associated rhomboid family serine protease